jgi:hypothetical protein
MASDALLRVSGPATGNYIQAAPVTVDGDLISTYAVNLGPNRQCQAQLRIGGTFLAGGGLAMQIYECDGPTGANPTLLAASPSLTRTHAADPSSATPSVQYPVAVTVFGFTTGSRGWVKATADATGTTSAAGVSVILTPVSGPVIKSGG